MSFRIDVDAATCVIRRVDEKPDGETVFATLGEAKAGALVQAVPERDSWADCIRRIREIRLSDVVEY